MNRVLVIVAAITMLNGAVWAGPDEVLLAAQNGDVQAQLEMGVLYEYGFPAAQSNVTALAWYLLAAEAGDTNAIKRRDRLSSKMTGEEIEQARQQSLTLLRRNTASPTIPLEPPTEIPPSSDTSEQTTRTE
jgi:hypothetical protein